MIYHHNEILIKEDNVMEKTVVELFAGVGNNPDFIVSDFFVDLQFFRTDVQAPPKNKTRTEFRPRKNQ